MTRTTFLPVLVGSQDAEASHAHVTDEFVGDLRVGYLVGPPSAQRLLTWDELDAQRLTARQLRRIAAENLYAALDTIGIHGQPPALMLSFDGLESSALLAHRFWDDLEEAVPGDLVVGVPARDVVIFTGSGSTSGLAKVRRAVDRMLFAGGEHLLSHDLLVRRDRCWHIWESDDIDPPWSVPPLSAQPYSGAPRSPVPYSSAPRSPVPYSGAPRSPVPVPAAPPPPTRVGPPPGPPAPRVYGAAQPGPRPRSAVASPPVRVPSPRTPRSSARVR